MRQVRFNGDQVNVLPPSRNPLSRRRRALQTLLTAAAIATLALANAGCDKFASPYSGIDLTGANWARDFRLPDAQGRERTLADYRGKYVMVFFGYIQCPVVCPTVLLHAAEARKALGPDGDRVQVIMITLDPERDAPALVREYAQAFDPSFVGLRGDLERTRDTAKEFHVYFEKVKTGSSYSIDHTAMTFVFDPRGRLRLGMPHQLTTEQFVADLRALMSATS